MKVWTILIVWDSHSVSRRPSRHCMIEQNTAQHKWRWSKFRRISIGIDRDLHENSREDQNTSLNFTYFTALYCTVSNFIISVLYLLQFILYWMFNVLCLLYCSLFQYRCTLWWWHETVYVVDSTAPSTSALVLFPVDHLSKSLERIRTKVGTIMLSDDCMRKFPPLCITLRGNLEGGTRTLITSVVSLLSVFLPLSSVAVRCRKVSGW